MNSGKVVIVLFAAALSAAGFAAEAPPAAKEPRHEIKHRFLAIDWPRRQLHHVDQFAPENNWSIKTPEHCRDIQLVGGNRVMISTGFGYVEYDLSTHAEARRCQTPGLKKVQTARRLPNGHTIIGEESGHFVEVDSEDKIVREANFAMTTLRLVRLTPGGNLLFGCDDPYVAEGTMDGKIVRKHKVEGTKHAYMVLPRANGNLLVSTGYGAELLELDRDGKVMKKWGGRPAPEGLVYYYFAGFQVLTNGHIVVSTWNGHGKDDSKNGQQVVEFDDDGKVVWTWHDPVMAGPIDGIIVLDDLDTSKLNSDETGILQSCLPPSIRAADNPYDGQAMGFIAQLNSPRAETRAVAAENLGYMRHYALAPGPLLKASADPSELVRRNAVIALGWCGNSESVETLLKLLGDPEWTVRQCAHVALMNVTGMKFPFDGRADETARSAQSAKWKTWWADGKASVEKDMLAQMDATDPIARERAFRAAGALGLKSTAPKLAAFLSKYEKNNNVAKYDDKKLIQAAIRSLGRLKDPAGLPVLLSLMDNAQFAPYAADALGDFGGDQAAAKLMECFPLYCRNLQRDKISLKYMEGVTKVHSTDAPGTDCNDRLPRVAYQIMFALSRLPITTSENRKRLAELVPYLVSNMPNDFDATMAYQPEPHQLFAKWLIDQTGQTQAIVDTAFHALGQLPAPPEMPQQETIRTLLADSGKNMRGGKAGFAPYASIVLTQLCRALKDIPLLLKLAATENKNNWVRINAIKTLIFMNAVSTADALGDILASSKREGDYGYCGYRFGKGNDGQDNFNDPAPRYRVALVAALGYLRSGKHVPLLEKILFDELNVMEVHTFAVAALDNIGDAPAVAVLTKAEREHPCHMVKIAAREALWKRGIAPSAPEDLSRRSPWPQQPAQAGLPTRYVFIKGKFESPNMMIIGSQMQKDNWRVAYSVSSPGPTYRPGDNLYTLDTSGRSPVEKQLTMFTEGYVADCEVSFDGKRVLFSHCGLDKDPWWHVYEINADGSGLRQITFGPYHDVQPDYMPDGRILFSSTRLGTRDEYHGYSSTGLSVMNADGTDIHCIGFNFGRDSEPGMGDDGRILFSRLELFYSRLKTEFNIESAFPDGTRLQTLYGPERRGFWFQHGAGINWFTAPPRHRVLKFSEIKPMPHGGYLINSAEGPATFENRFSEKILHPDLSMAITTPYPLNDKTILCAAGKKDPADYRVGEPKKGGERIVVTHTVDLALCFMDVASGGLTPFYNDPQFADFEARPLRPRFVPPVLAEAPQSRGSVYTGKIYCGSLFMTQEPEVPKRGALVRLVEGLPPVQRHMTQSTSTAWKNHAGSVGRILGTVPVSPNGAFGMEIPADRFVHLQALDTEGHVVGNQLLWMYVRPGEVKGCIGCHEKPDTSPQLLGQSPYPATFTPCLPKGDDFLYRAKVWIKGSLQTEREERMRTVNSLNVMGRE